MKYVEENKKEIIDLYKNSNGNLNITANKFNLVSKWQIRNLLQKEGLYGKIKKIETKEEKSRRKSLHVINFKKNKKVELVEYKGGKCEKCGYNKCIEALEFHHKDPTQKDFNISSHSYSSKRMKDEADKCLLLCANCHREEHVLLKLQL
jgi:transposase-like protein